jgi:hypothetical protein
VKILKAGGQGADKSELGRTPASSLSGLRRESDPMHIESQIELCGGKHRGPGTKPKLDSSSRVYFCT